MELRQTFGESKVTLFRACSRDGRPSPEDLETVQQMAATMGRIMNDTAEGPNDGPAGRAAMWRAHPGCAVTAVFS